MENSTKALLIAGTVLVVLVLIGLGMKLFNSSASLSDDVAINSESTAASNFNAQFMSCLGNSVSPTQVRELVKKVMINNSQASSSTKFSASSHQIYLNLYKKNGDHRLSGGGHKWTVSDLQYLYNTISDDQTYKVSVTTDCRESGATNGFYDGYILCISIREKK